MSLRGRRRRRDETAAVARHSNDNLFQLNGAHISVTLDADRAAIIDVRGRFSERDDFGDNLIAPAGVAWRVLADEGAVAPARRRLDSVVVDDTRIDCSISHLGSDGRFMASTVWRLSLDGDGVRVSTRIAFVEDVAATAVALEVPATQPLFVALYESGVVQQVQSGIADFASDDQLHVFYTIEHDVGSLAVVPHLDGPTVIRRNETAGAIALSLVRSGHATTGGTWGDAEWTSGTGVHGGTVLDAEFSLYANDLPFPTHALQSSAWSDPIAARTHHTALYATSLAALGGHEITGSAYPTIASPDREYWTLHTFFDPDAWTTVGALSYSGEPLLQREALRILERARSGLTDVGQVPHHFDGEEPLYVAISGAAQTGPNLFWILAGLDYAAGTGDTTWLRDAWESGLVAAMDWVLGFLDDDRSLLNVTGPLWVDVFRREGYTFDTNAAAVHVLERMADAAVYLDRTDEAERYREIASRIRTGLEALWRDDHFVTGRRRDWDTIQDMGDGENYLAVAFGLVDDDRARALLTHMDAIPTMHPGGRGTGVSETFYGPDDCYGENTGDSDIAMARLWWGDMMARQAVGDSATFTTMFEAVRGDLLDTTWMTERYGTDGAMVRAAGYHEYPEVLDTVMREGYYGVHVGLTSVVIRPMIAGEFTMRIGDLALTHARDLVHVRVPGDGMRTFTVHGLAPDARYVVDGDVIGADGDGVLTFTGLAGVEHALVIGSAE